MKHALILLSGGLDSSTCLAVAIEEGYTVSTLAFDYGQRHRVELEKSTAIANHYRVERQLIIALPFYRALGGSALTDSTEVPKHVDVAQMHCSNGVASESQIPVTYVPGRNLVFLSIAVGTAEMIGADDIFIGVNALDYSGYPDCRPDFIEQFEKTAKLATRTGVLEGKIKIQTPLLALTKCQIVQLAHRLEVPLALTHSCYDPVDTDACGHCDSCLLRLKGFEEAGLSDPVSYVGIANGSEL